MFPERFRSVVDEIRRRAGIAGVSSRTVVVIVSVGLLLGMSAAVRWWPRAGERFDLRPAQTASAPGASADATTPGSAESSPVLAASVFVHVVGAVRTPGMYELTAGARVADAVAAAGGLLGSAEPRGINLAREVADGEQILVPDVDEWAAGSSAQQGAGTGVQGVAGAGVAAAAGSGSGGALIDLNTATPEQLDALPGVGPSTAAKIVSDREANGPFTAPEDLMRVSGIGPKRFDALKDLIVAR